MSRATGIHLTGNTLRLVCLDDDPAGYRLSALIEARLPIPFRPAALHRADTRQRLARSIGEALAGFEGDLGSVVTSVGGGLFQLHKVPLEVASEEDRRDQITWEVSQAMISPAEDYIVDFYPAGRTAFWVAIRREAVDLCTDLYAAAGISLKGLEVEPIALFHACEMARVWTSGRSAAILSGYPWLSFVAADKGQLMAAETARVNWQPPLATPETAADGVQNPTDLQDMAEIARRWVCGDLATDLRRTAYSRVFFCGNEHLSTRLIGRLRTAPSPDLIPLQPFAACDIGHVPEHQRHLIARQSAFGVAAGLAYRGLKEDQK